jgi:DNA-binding IclR family transcriptional regulator
MDSVRRVGVIDKSVAILEALGERGPSSLSDLVDVTGFTRPTVHRLALALERHGLLGRDPAGRFRLGLRLVAWGAEAAAAFELVELARPVLAELRDATDESAQLYVRDDDRRVCVASAERRRGLRDTVPIGASLPLTAGSGGAVLLAWADESERLPGVDPARLTAVRARGWAASVGEREAGVASVSAPILDASGRLVAAVSVSGPIDRLGRRPGPRLAPAVTAAARAPERRAGFRQPTAGGRRH